jgi:hypothetical protein
MLRDFFELNSSGPILTLPDGQRLKDHFRNSRSLKNSAILPGQEVRHGRLADVSFENVKLSHLRFVEMTFTRCTFTDCLLIGTQFQDCEFHECGFIDCNTYKIILRNVYVDPRAFRFHRQYRRKTANIGSYLYQQLYQNSEDTHQRAFAASADVERRRWFRYQRIWELANRREGTRSGWASIAADLAFDLVAKYGYGPLRFLLVSGAVFALLGLIAFVFWPHFGMTRAGDQIADIGYGAALYYCMQLVTTLGFSSLMPESALGRAFAIACAVIGIAWAGVFTSILVRRVIR